MAKELKHYIREQMKVAGVNQERLADLIDAQSATVSKLLSGRMRLSDIWMIKIADALNIEVVDLFRHPDRSKIDRMLDSLSDEKVSQVSKIIGTFLPPEK